MRRIKTNSILTIVIVCFCHNLFAVENQNQDHAQQFSRLLGSCIVSRTGNTLKLKKPFFTNIIGSTVLLDEAVHRQRYYQKILDCFLNEKNFPMEVFDPRFSFYLVLFGNKQKGEILKKLVLMRPFEAEAIAKLRIAKNSNDQEANVVLALLSIRKEELYHYLDKKLNENPTKTILLVDWGIRFLSITEPNRFAWDFLSKYLHFLVLHQEKIDFEQLPDETLRSIYTGLLFKYSDNVVNNHYKNSKDSDKVAALKNLLLSRLQTSLASFTPPKKSSSLPNQNMHMTPNNLLHNIPSNLKRFENPYKLMQPTYFRELEKSAKELISEKKDFRWANIPIRNWACICIGIDKLVPDAKIINRDSLLFSFALLCAEEYEESLKIALRYIEHDSTSYSANLILALLTIYDSRNVRYLIRSFQLNPQKTLIVLNWFSANTLAISNPKRYRDFLRIWLSCAADYREQFQNIPPLEARYLCSRIRNFSLQNEEKIKLLYVQLNKLQSTVIGF